MAWRAGIIGIIGFLLWNPTSHLAIIFKVNLSPEEDDEIVLHSLSVFHVLNIIQNATILTSSM